MISFMVGVLSRQQFPLSTVLRGEGLYSTPLQLHTELKAIQLLYDIIMNDCCLKKGINIIVSPQRNNILQYLVLYAKNSQMGDRLSLLVWGDEAG